MAYYVGLDELTGNRYVAKDLNEARRIARTRLHNVRILGSRAERLIPTKYGIKQLPNVAIYKSLTGKKEVGFVIAADGYYWVTYSKTYGAVSYAIKKDGSLITR